MSELEGLRWKRFSVLDQGSVTVADVMGDDQAIADAARISYGKGTRSVSDDRTLLRYLMRHNHATPFEMAELKLIIRAPMDVWRQLVRHRAGRLVDEQCMWDDPSVNEYSTRYSEAIDAMQATPPGGWRMQATGNKQGSAGFLGTETRYNAFDPDAETGDSTTVGGDWLSDREAKLHRMARDVYEERIGLGVAREQARKDLPLSTYTEAYWKCDLRNVLGFLALRMDSHAQAEIRAYADVIGREIVAKLFPITWEAFEDYTLNAMTLSARDIRVIQALVAAGLSMDETLVETDGMGVREIRECWEKLMRLGIARN